MRFPTVVLLASACGLAACDGGSTTAPNETPSFARISGQTEYTATLTCSARASRSFANIAFRGVLGTFLFCDPIHGNQAKATGFTEFNWTILLKDNTETVKVCPRKGEVSGSSTRTGQFVCKDAKTGLSVVLTLEPS